MRMAASRQGSAAGGSSNYLWSPTAADCAVDSETRPASTRCAHTVKIWKEMKMGVQQLKLPIKHLAHLQDCACSMLSASTLSAEAF